MVADLKRGAIVARSFVVFGAMALLSSCVATGGKPAAYAKPAPPQGVAAMLPPHKEEKAAAVTPVAADGLAVGAKRFVQYGSPPSERLTAAAPAGDGEIALSFLNAPVRDVLASVFDEILNLPYAVDPGVQGTVSLQTNERIAKEAVLPALEQALLYSGLALYKDAGGIYHVTPLETASQSAVLGPMAEAAGSPGYGVSVFRMRYAPAQQIAELVKPLVPRTAVLTADPARNMIMVAGPGPVRSNIGDLLHAFDVDDMAEKSVGLFPLSQSEAKSVAEELSKLFGVAGDRDRAAPIRFVSIERLNAVLVIASSAPGLDRAEAWIQRLDKEGSEGDGRRLAVYRLQNVRATDIAEALGKLFGVPWSREPTREKSLVAPGMEPATISSAPAEESQQTPSASEKSAYDAFSLGRDGLQVVSDDASNAIIALGTEGEHRRIRAALRELDVAPLQVLIEAMVAEVTLNDQLRFGLQWFFRDGKHTVTLSNISTGAVAPVFPGFAHVFSDTNAKVVIDALSEVTNVRIVSSPQIMVLNNQSAELQVGDQVPIVTRSAIATGSEAAPVINSIEFRDTGVILRVTPRVNAGGLVIVEIEQEVSSVVKTTTSGIDSPTIQRRRIESHVAVQSGETIALGGLMQDSKTKSESGTPWLARIPILGNFFKVNRDSVARTELLVLMTPRVADNMTRARALTDELRMRLGGARPPSGTK